MRGCHGLDSGLERQVVGPGEAVSVLDWSGTFWLQLMGTELELT